MVSVGENSGSRPRAPAISVRNSLLQRVQHKLSPLLCRVLPTNRSIKHCRPTRTPGKTRQIQRANDRTVLQDGRVCLFRVETDLVVQLSRVHVQAPNPFTAGGSEVVQFLSKRCHSFYEKDKVKDSHCAKLFCAKSGISVQCNTRILKIMFMRTLKRKQIQPKKMKLL